MKILFVLFILSPLTAFADLAHWEGYCNQGGQVVVTNSATSTTKVQQSYPLATLTVYQPNTVTKASIFSDASGTVLANPFTCSSKGYFQFWATAGFLDLTFSGTGVPAPFTWGSVGQSVPGAGGGGTPNVPITHTFTGTQEVAYVHSLNTLTPVMSCYDNSNSQAVLPGVNMTTPAILSTTYMTATNITMTCAFNNSGGGGGAGGGNANLEYSASRTMNSSYCPSWLGTFTGTAPLTFTLATPIAGCVIVIQNNTTQTFTVNVTTNSLTLNGQTSNATIPACSSPTTGCSVATLKANGTTSWDMGK